MVVLTAAQLQDGRQFLSRGSDVIGWTKAEINAVLQAIEDNFENVYRASVSAAIDVAKAGISNADKKRIVKWYLRHKFERE